jgi:glycine cleavage system H protein
LEIVEINEAVVAYPPMLDSDPFGTGWLFRMKVTGAAGLLDAAACEAVTGA